MGFKVILRVVTVATIVLLAQNASAAGGYDAFNLGLEGFYDNYKEDAFGVDNKAGYGSVTGGYSHDFGGIFGAVDGRASYGSEKYSSPDGSDSGVPQWEFELRGRGGVNLAVGGGTLSPYAGLGLRYYRDDAKNTSTDLGYVGYDRRITQLYIPIGVTYTTDIGNGWFMAPNAEFDPLVYGHVDSRLQNAGYYNLSNTQDSGYGIRGEWMFGQKTGGVANTTTWEVGPFVRYWNIKDSDVTTAPDGSQWIEPDNTRLQVGGALRVNW